MPGAAPGEPRTAIVADSTVCLPPDLVRGLPLFTVPFEVHHAGRVYLDGVDLTPAAFYALLKQGAKPTTSAPQPGAFLRAFQQAAASGATDVVCLTLAAQLSASHTAAQTAAAEAVAALPGVRVTVVDTRTGAAAEGLIALAAARAATAGVTTGDVLAGVGRDIEQAWLLGYLETLEHLWRGGRVPRVAMWLGKVLDVKPILALSAGRIGMVERPRTRERAMARLLALAGERLRGRPARIAVMHAAAPEPAAELAGRIRRALAPVELFTTEMTPVIGAHTGPGLVALAALSVE